MCPSNASIRIVLVNSIFLMLTGCANPQRSPFGDADVVLKSAADVGTVSVKAFPPLAFSSIKEKLIPKIGISDEEAGRDAINITSQDDISYADSIRLRLAIGLQSRIREKNLVRETGKEDISSTTNKTSSGTLPEQTDLEQVVLETLRELTTPSVADAILRYSSRAGLMQFVGWLDNYLSNIDLPDNYEASLVTFQVTSQPHRPNLPVDSYVDITLWPSSKASENVPQKLPMVMVSPILITDNLEANSRNLRASHDRNSNFSAQGMPATNTPFSFGFGSSSSSERQRLGQDLNGVTTVAFDDNNHIRVRLGAQAQASASTGYGMVSRSHIVTVLVVTHKDIPALDVVTQSHFVDVRDGRALCDKGADADCKKDIQALAQEFGLDIKACNALNNRTVEMLKGNDEDVSDLWRDLNGIIKDVHIVNARNCLGRVEGKADAMIGREWSRFFASVVTSVNRTKLYSSTLPIPGSPDPKLPDNDQTIILKETETSTKAFLRGGQGLSKSTLSAYWITGDKIKIAAEKIEVGENGSDISMEFPNYKAKNTTLVNGEISLILASKADNQLGGSVQRECESTLYPSKKSRCTRIEGGIKDLQEIRIVNNYLALLQETKERKAPSINPLKVDVATINSTFDGKGQVIVRMAAPQKFPVTISVRGADIIEHRESGVSTPLGITLKAPGIVRLSLNNLSVSHPIQISAYANNEQLGSSIFIPVIMLPKDGENH